VPRTRLDQLLQRRLSRRDVLRSGVLGGAGWVLASGGLYSLAQGSAAPRRELERPRIALNEGFSRVAVDVPVGSPYGIGVLGNRIALLLPEVTIAPFSRLLEEDPHIARVRYQYVEGTPAVVVEARHELAVSGRGFQVGMVPRDSHDTLFVDLAPTLMGSGAVALRDGAFDQPTQAANPAEGADDSAAARQPDPRPATVVIDAGHGGRDPGAITSWAVEKEIVLSVSLMLEERLKRRGIRVIMTRDTDTFISLQERSEFATPDRTMFVSVHANGAPNANANGIETFTFGRPLEQSQLERAIAENGGGEIGAARTAEAAGIADDFEGDVVRESQLNYSTDLAKFVQSEMVGATGAIDRGVRQNLFYVIRNSRIPAILVELGFVTHRSEGQRLMQRDHQTKLANALDLGINNFITSGAGLATL